MLLSPPTTTPTVASDLVPASGERALLVVWLVWSLHWDWLWQELFVKAYSAMKQPDAAQVFKT